MFASDQTTSSLQYLTIEQALSDLDTFIDTMNRVYFSNYSNIKWITFGGSYPGKKLFSNTPLFIGTLSAFFREAFPSRTIGAVSTSSAVHFQVDYYGWIKKYNY